MRQSTSRRLAYTDAWVTKAGVNSENTDTGGRRRSSEYTSRPTWKITKRPKATNAPRVRRGDYRQASSLSPPHHFLTAEIWQCMYGSSTWYPRPPRYNLGILHWWRKTDYKKVRQSDRIRPATLSRDLTSRTLSRRKGIAVSPGSVQALNVVNLVSASSTNGFSTTVHTMPIKHLLLNLSVSWMSGGTAYSGRRILLPCHRYGLSFQPGLRHTLLGATLPRYHLYLYL